MIFACGFLSRMRGFLGRPSTPERIVLIPCNDIHTFGMKDSLDVAFFDRAGHVIAAYTDVVPKRRIKHKEAAFVVEWFSAYRESGPVYRAGDMFISE